MGRREKPNVLFIAIDTLRADHLGCYGYPLPTSPHLDRVAGEGVLFLRAFAPSIPTHPGYTTMLTGAHPLVHGIVCHSGQRALSRDIKLISEILRGHGYVTAAADNLAVTRNGEWFVRGYDYYFNIGGYMVISKGVKIHGEIACSKALEFLDLWDRKMVDRSFFLFVHFWDPHAPYYPPSGLVEKVYEGDPSQGDLEEKLRSTRWGRRLLRSWLGGLISKGVRSMDYVRALYDAEIAYTDEKVRILLERLDDLGIAGDTMIVITSDHGESMGEHNIFFDHHGLYEWDVRVPLIIRYPGVFPRGKRIGRMVQHTDIVPTILDAAGVPAPGHVSGRSLLSLISGGWGGYERVLLMENTRMTKRAIRTERWKLIQTVRPDPYGKPAGYLELYDVERDPGETRNLAEECRDIALRLLGELEESWRGVLGGRIDPLMEQEISLPISAI